MKWPVRRIGDLFRVARGGSPRPIQSFLTEAASGLNWIMIGDATDGSKYIERTKNRIKPEGLKKSRMVHEGDFLLTNSMSFGRPYILKTSGCIHDGWLVLSPLHDDISRDFFYYLLGSNAIYDEFAKRAAGAVVKNLNSEIVRNVEVPLPPLPEQKRIAAILDAADALRAKRREALAQLDTLLQSTFLDMFGDPVTNTRGWKVAPFGTIGTSRLGKMLDRGKETGARQYRYLANTNVQWGSFNLEELRTMEFSDADRQEFQLTDGDLLICEGGEVGRTAIWRNGPDDIFFQKALHRVRLDPSLATPEYVFHFMWFMAHNGGFADLTNSATIAHLTGIKLRRLKIPLPPLEEQHHFARIVDSVERQRAHQGSHLADLDTLFASLQSRAFRGEL